MNEIYYDDWKKTVPTASAVPLEDFIEGMNARREYLITHNPIMKLKKLVSIEELVTNSEDKDEN